MINAFIALELPCRAATISGVLKSWTHVQQMLVFVDIFTKCHQSDNTIIPITILTDPLKNKHIAAAITESRQETYSNQLNIGQAYNPRPHRVSCIDVSL